MTTTEQATFQELGSVAAIRLVAGREIRTRMATKGFRLTTLFLVLAVVAWWPDPATPSTPSESAQHVGVSPAAAASAGADRGRGCGRRGQGGDRDGHGRGRAPRTGSAPGTSTRSSRRPRPDVTIVVKDKLDPSLTPMFGAWRSSWLSSRAVDELGGDPRQVTQQIATAAPQVKALQPTPEVDGGQVVAGYVAGILLFLSLMTAGQLVAQGVVEEKSSRVVELLLSTLRPWQLMAGKVLGIGIVGLTQVAATLGAGVAMAFATGLVNSTSLDVGSTAAWALVWFVVGFASYALVLAALGSARLPTGGRRLRHRPRDGTDGDPVHHRHQHRAVGPAQPARRMAVLRPVLRAVDHADPDRGRAESETWEILLSLTLSLAVIPVLVWIAARVYSNAVLRSGSRVGLREAMRG